MLEPGATVPDVPVGRRRGRSLSAFAQRSRARVRRSSASTSSTGRPAERTRCCSCVTGAPTSDAAGVRPFGISRDSPWSHVAWASHLAVDVGTAPLGLERRGDPRLRRGVRGARNGGRADAERVPDRGRYGQGLVAAAEGDAGHRRRDRGGFLALALALYAASALWATWPAVRHLDGGRYLARPAPGYGEAAAGDHLQLGWAFWLPGHQLEHGAAPWADPYSFRPEASASPNLQGWLLATPFWPLRVLFGNVWAYDLVVLLSFVAAGGLACWWLRALGLSRGAALAGGLVFALAPYRVGQSTGHLLGLISFLLPATLLALERRRFVWAGARAGGDPALGTDPPRDGRRPARARLRLGPRSAKGLVAGGCGRARGGGRGDRRPAGGRGGLDRGRRALVRTGAALLGGALRFPHARRRGGDRGARLRGLADAAPGGRRTVGGPAAARARALPRPRGAHPLPARARLEPAALRAALARPPAAPLRARPGAAAAGQLPRGRRPRRVRPRRGGAPNPCGSEPQAGCSAPLSSPPCSCCSRSTCAYRCSPPSPRIRRTPPTRRSDGDGRMLELPVFRPDIHYGSVYLGYARQSPRERPQGYSTTAPPAADRLARELRGSRAAAGRFRRSSVSASSSSTAGSTAQSGFFAPGCADKAETALRRHGWRLLARAGQISSWQSP